MPPRWRTEPGNKTCKVGEMVMFDCDVHGLPYQCVVPNTKYYFAAELKLKLKLCFQIFLCGSFNVSFYTSQLFHLLLLQSSLDSSSKARSWEVEKDKTWTLLNRLNPLRRLLNGCERISSLDYLLYSPVQRDSSSGIPRVRLDLYFDKNSRDFGLLMDLLAESSGIVQSLRYSL